MVRSIFHNTQPQTWKFTATDVAALDQLSGAYSRWRSLFAGNVLACSVKFVSRAAAAGAPETV